MIDPVADPVIDPVTDPVAGGAPSGFRAAGVAAGLAGTGAPDLALLVNDGPLAHAAGVFTRNEAPAAPVLWSRQVLTTGRLRVVVLNSGGANAGTGPEGFQTAHATAERAASALGCGAVEVAVCSTGPTDVPLPRDAVLAGVDTAAVRLSAGGPAITAAAEVLRSTGAGLVQAGHRDAGGWGISGVATGTGTGTAAPATTLAVLCTDAVVDPAELDRALRSASARSFERPGADGAAGGFASAGDTVLLLASGASGVDAPGPEFTAALTEVCAALAGRSGTGTAVAPTDLPPAHAEGNATYPS